MYAVIQRDADFDGCGWACCSPVCQQCMLEQKSKCWITGENMHKWIHELCNTWGPLDQWWLKCLSEQACSISSQGPCFWKSSFHHLAADHGTNVLVPTCTIFLLLIKFDKQSIEAANHLNLALECVLGTCPWLTLVCHVARYLFTCAYSQRKSLCFYK